MHIEELDLDDFGCFERARVTDLSDGLTVIAGPQRAGKTTFMEAVRCLGYGISRGDDLPPPSDRYEMTATVAANGYRYRLEIDGFADPQLTALDGGPERDVQDLFGGLSAAHYRQLYTISLDELRRIPRNLDDDANLSAILLGAAYGDVLDIPTVRDEFADTASDIGGVRASARGVYQMKDPMNRIQEGIEERNEAVEQVDEYERTHQERQNVAERIEDIDAELFDTDEEQTRLEAVVTNHDDFDRLCELEAELETVDGETLGAFPTDTVDDVKPLRETHEERRRELEEAIDEFDVLADPEIAASDMEDAERDEPIEVNGGRELAAVRDRLLEIRSEIREYAAEKSGWNERVNSLKQGARELQRRRGELERKAANLHPDWDGDLERIAEIDTDPISSERLRSAVEDYQEAKSEVESAQEEIAELEERYDTLEDRIASSTSSSGGLDLAGQYPTAIGGAVASIVVGGATGIVAGPIAGVLVTALLFIVTGAYVASKLDTGEVMHDGVSVETLRAEREKVDAKLDGRRETLENRREVREDTASELAEIAKALSLPSDTPPGAISQFYDNLVELQSDLETLEDEVEEIEERKSGLRAELQEVGETLESITILEETGEDPLADAATLFTAIDRAVEQLETAETVVEAERALERTETDLIEKLEEWPDSPDLVVGESKRIDEAAREFVERGEEVQTLQEAVDERDAIRNRLRNQLTIASVERTLEPYQPSETDDEWHIDAYERVLQEYNDIAGIEDRLEELDNEREDLKSEREGLVERRVELDAELEDLASDDDVREAHATIERGRKQLEPLAEQYATARIAEHLLDGLHERFIARTTGPLLEDASEILERITNGTYEAVDSENEFDEIDFVAQLRDGSEQRTSELSRATAEQLFLAVRLARIRHHNASLPVLLDDSLTNFDPGHAERTLETIAELTDNTQVFVLTCHPSLLDRIESRVNADYWCLDDGRFDGPYKTADRPRALLNGG